MSRRILACMLSLAWLAGVVNKTAGQDANVVSKPTFMVVLWDAGKARIVRQGPVAQPVFRRLFLEAYGVEGERPQAGKKAELRGVLVARDETRMAAVPIKVWQLPDGSSGWLCQASQDGTPPAFSVPATSEPELLSRIEQALGAEQ